MDAAGQWDVEVASPLGALHFDVRILDTGAAVASYHGHRIEVPAMQTVPEGDGIRVRWTQRLTVPVRIRIGVDALVVGDRMTGSASAGFLFPSVPLQGRRVR